jgi:hypothetical protein
VAGTACQPLGHAGTSGEPLAAVSKSTTGIAQLVARRAGRAQSWCVSLAPA